MSAQRPRIAIVGIGGVLPAAPGQPNDIDTFWQNVRSGADLSRPVPPGRWLLHADDAYDSRIPAPDKVYSTCGCFVDDWQCDGEGLDIDTDLLGRLDPVFHIGLRAAREAFNDAHMQAVDRERIGVIIGNIALPTDKASAITLETLGAEFERQVLNPSPLEGRGRVRGESSQAMEGPPLTPTLSLKGRGSLRTDRINRYVAGLPGGMIARALNLGGGSYTLDAACASSLYALKLASDELIAGRADAMIAGGMSRPDCLYTQMGFCQLLAMSPSGHCSPFDRKADGLVVGEGAGFVILKRLDDALRDGDHIYATIAGVGLSNDIGGSLFGPDSEGQLRALRAAYRNAGWSPADVDLIECHGTGTPTGDAVELQSLRTMWEGSGRECVIGSVKSNVGHLLTGAGGAGLIKTLLAMRDGVLPPTANFEQASQAIEPFAVLTEARDWEPRDGDAPRRAAVTAFGFGGINAHVLLEQFTPSPLKGEGWGEGRGVNDQVARHPHPNPLPQRERGPDIAIVGIGEMGPTIDAIDFPMQRFRIPPSELQQMLPQQLVMLQVAAMALDDAKLADADHVETGVYIGIELDMNTTNFHLRWSLLNQVRQWGADLDEERQDEWAAQLRDAAGPPLTADRVMGSLGGIVASRVARAFRVGGPSFTVSSEQTSGLRAMEAAIRALQQHELNQAIVGAVDLTRDPRDGGDCDSGVAVIVKRLDDAKRDGDRIYAVLPGVGAVDDDGAVTVEHHEGGAAAGMRAVAEAARALDQRIRLDRPQYWLHNRADGPRRVAAEAHGVGGDSARIVLEEYENAVPATQSNAPLYVVESDDVGGLIAQLVQLRSSPLPARQVDDGKQLAVAIIADSQTQLKQRIDQVIASLQDNPGAPMTGPDVYYAPQPLRGEVAFVYPGSGSQFVGMGREHAAVWPQVLERQHQENEYLSRQFVDGRLWEQSIDDPGRVIFAQVVLGSMMTDLMAGFGVRPGAVIGYSLGETAALFSTRAWTQRDEMLRRVEQSSLFKTDLCGACDAAKTLWGAHEVDWTIGVIDRPAQAVPDRDRAYLLIVNTPGQCVIGGDRAHVMLLVNELGCTFHELHGVTTMHCEVATVVEQAYRDLHLFDTMPAEGVRYYSGIFGGAYELTRDSAADSITGQAVAPFDYTKVIESAYADGMRLFIEMGPGASCSRMIDQILGERPHATAAVCVSGQSASASVRRVLGRLIAERVSVDLSWLYGDEMDDADDGPTLRIPVGLQPFDVPAKPAVANPLLAQAIATEAATASAHEAYLKLSHEIEQTMVRVLGGIEQRAKPPAVADLRQAAVPVAFDRAMCMEFAVGSIGRVLGDDYAPIDDHPTRVRLPDEPLMLVDRIVAVEGEPLSMTHGRVVTEHDVLPGAWYLDGGRIPTCIAVEAGQADLFLSGYLGVDFQTRGHAVYRLLDAQIVFHSALPRQGETIRYDIHIDHFFCQGDTWLFRFRFDGTVDGELVLQMRNGVAGFFTQQALDAGRGIVRTLMHKNPPALVRPDDWQDLAAPAIGESYDEAQLAALREGDLARCFGDAFADLSLQQPHTIPGADGSRMRLVDRVVELDTSAGRIVGELDIHPDDWFLTCHFCDDMVKPGTLMYECCMHTLRILLLRMGWVGEEGEVVCEPVPGQASTLKCRGQVIASTKKVTYEISVRELGYEDDGTPYCLADAMMYADGRAIVEMTNMSLRYTGLNRGALERMWSHDDKPVVNDHQQILEYAHGSPSKAFGPLFKPFDRDRFMARLPSPPYNFVHRVTQVSGCELGQLRAGGEAVGEYDVPADAWYFAAERQPQMPFAVLLEIPLQTCGWLSAYVGSSLAGDEPLHYRNLGGDAVLHRNVPPHAGTLTTCVKMTSLSHAAGMIIQHFDIALHDRDGLIYDGKTYFGFFTGEALANQVGLRDVEPIERAAGEAFEYPRQAPYSDDMMRMVDRITSYAPRHNYIEGAASVDPSAWFFKAHFYQDPVWPGSLGLESLLQLMKVDAAKRFGFDEGDVFESMAPGTHHGWEYRGQIVPPDSQVMVQSKVTDVDEAARLVRANGLLTVDGRNIYQMTDFAIRIRCDR